MAGVCARNSVLLSQRAAVSTTGPAKSGNAWVDGIDIFENEKNPERDHVNFPRRKREEFPSPVRHWWIPGAVTNDIPVFSLDWAYSVRCYLIFYVT